MVNYFAHFKHPNILLYRPTVNNSIVFHNHSKLPYPLPVGNAVL